MTNATVQVGPADASGLEEGTFDVVMLRHVLAHNGRAEQRIVDHLAALAKPGGRVYLVDVSLGSSAMSPTSPFFTEVTETYARFMSERGNDVNAGFTLADRLAAAGLAVEEFRGWFTILQPPPGMRPPPWAARDAMVEAGVLRETDLARWERDFALLDAAQPRPTLFMPSFVGIGRKP